MKRQILTDAEQVGLGIQQRVFKMVWRGMREARPLVIALSPRAWECLLGCLLQDNHPIEVLPNGSEARLRLYVGGQRVLIAADKTMESFDESAWVVE